MLMDADGPWCAVTVFTAKSQEDIMVFSYQGFELFNAINRNNICGVKYIFIKEKLKWLIG